MKKLIILLIFSTMLVLVGISGQNIGTDDIKHEIYISNSASVDALEQCDVIDTGAFKIVRVDDRHYDKVRASLDGILGESISYRGCESDVYRLIDAHDIAIYDDDMIDGNRILYGYMDELGEGVELKGERVNIQLKYGNNMIQIGTPLIMGSY